MDKELTSEEKHLVEEELRILSEVLESLEKQSSYVASRLSTESKRARELTSELVAARREEDKAMLASEEAVSHALRDKKVIETKTLERLLQKPYFARFVAEEEKGNQTKSFEYRLGVAANPECRIVDWRKAPVSKLYYEYQEGDYYAESIQGREREGRIALRHALQIERGTLKQIRCRYGVIRNENGVWIKDSAGGFGTGERHLKSIVSLITPEQFQTITEDADTAILIQGIAGSGKTTVAMHRLAWLLHEDNSEVQAEDALVVVLSNALRSYVSQTLPSMQIEGVEVTVFKEFAADLASRILPDCTYEDGTLRRPESTPLSVTRLKHSLALLWTIEELAKEHPDLDYYSLLLQALSNPRIIIDRDDTKLIDTDLVKQAWMHSTSLQATKSLDEADDALVARVYQVQRGGIPRKNSSSRYFDHMVIDEVQDLSPAQLACLIGSVKRTRDVTLVGDTAQKVDSRSVFPGWDRLRKHWSFDDESSRYVSLSITHRSTLEIMKVADYVQGRTLVTDGRRGKAPIWFRCPTESKGIAAVIQWMQTATERYPNAISAVICATPAEAKHAYSLLEPSFGAIIRLGDENSFTFDEGIIVTDVKQVKGLEFLNVLIWNPSPHSYPSNEQGRNKLYVAISRAEENLCFVTWGRHSALLPHIHSPLIRGIDLVAESEENSESRSEP